MRFLDKLFKIKKKKPSGKNETEGSSYMPISDLPLDEKFAVNFKKNGGKFLYCDSIDEIHKHFGNILSENKWEGTKILCYNKPLEKKFGDFDIEYTETDTAPTHSFFATCEYLVADTGSILVSSNQIREKRLGELPDNLIIFATTSQIVRTIGEGLRGIKDKYQDKIPTNITTVEHFETKAEKNFLTYGSSSKNLYLLLLEDL